MVSKIRKHARGSNQAIICPVAIIILTEALSQTWVSKNEKQHLMGLG